MEYKLCACYLRCLRQTCDMDLRHSYFAIPNPLDWLRRRINPYCHRETIILAEKVLVVEWTRRADRAMQKRATPLFVDMQLYFSCVVQKRVLFHDATDHDVVAVNGRLSVMFRPVEAQSCDPQTFADNHPVKRELLTRSATMMHPRILQIDYKDADWIGSYSV